MSESSMPGGSSGGDRQTKNDRRRAAQEKARQLRETQKKKERRGKWLLQGGLIVVAVAVVGIVTLVIVNSVQPAGPGPRNMASDGIVIGQGYTAVTTPAIADGEDPVPNPVPVEGEPIAISVYLDYQCPICNQFEEANTDQISTWLESGAATVAYYPVAILDRASQGTRYSSRAANAAACVADTAPDSFFDFSTALFQNQPEEGTSGLTDEEIVSIAAGAGVSGSAFESCVADESFKSWVTAATNRATSDPELQGTQGFGTPTVLVNGERYTGSPADGTAFAQFVAAADGAEFAEPSPSPSASPSASPSEAPAG